MQYSGTRQTNQLNYLPLDIIQVFIMFNLGDKCRPPPVRIKLTTLNKGRPEGLVNCCLRERRLGLGNML